jgi:hypothetical protein
MRKSALLAVGLVGAVVANSPRWSWHPTAISARQTSERLSLATDPSPLCGGGAIPIFVRQVDKRDPAVTQHGSHFDCRAALA